MTLYFPALVAVSLLRRRYELTPLEALFIEPVLLLLLKSAFLKMERVSVFPAKEEYMEARRDDVLWICTVLVLMCLVRAS